MLKDNIKSGIFNAMMKVFGSKFTRETHNFYKRVFDTDSRFEKELIIKTLGYVGKGGIVLDIGANIGRWAIPISEKIGDTGHVFAFEPNEESLSFLRHKVSGLQNVSTYKIALSNGDAEQQDFLIQKGVSCPPNAAVANTASQITDKENFDIVKVPTSSLDNFIKAHNIRIIDFIKIDVEGHELEVIKGFKNGIAMFTPILAIEILNEKWKGGHACTAEVVQLLLKEGYTVGQFNEISHTYEFDQDKFGDFENFIFIKN